MRALAPIAAMAQCILCGGAAFGLELAIANDAVPSAALVATQGPSPAALQSEVTRITSQAALSEALSPAEGLSLSGTAWTLLDSLPDYNPSQVPPSRLDFSSRILQLDLSWQLLPGSLILSLGKEIIHPSSGFFKTPLNLVSRGAAGNAPQQTPAASPQWEEGWIGTKVVWISGEFTFEDFFSPRLQWSEGASEALQYISLPQPDFQDQLRVDAHVGTADIQALVLLSTGGPGSSDPTIHFQTGAGLDANLGDRLTLRAEATLSDSLDRLGVTDASALATATQSLPWVARALAGFTWSVDAELSLMAEYYYNGLGFDGSDYSNVLQYAKSRLSQYPEAPDIAGQFGAFSSARHYGFLRVADDFTDRITGQAWTQVNLQDLSGMYGIGIASKYDAWGLSGSITETWGGAGTEAQALPFLWQLDIELQFYL
jgi:hypothetical protein